LTIEHDMHLSGGSGVVSRAGSGTPITAAPGLF
jgi:hypothetical protein